MSYVNALNANQQLASVRLVATTNQVGTYVNGPLNNGVGATFIYASGVLTIDGVDVNLNDYILLADQSLAYQNGIYQCTQVGAVGVPAILTRRADFQCREQIQGGYYVPVSAGSASAGSVWVVVEPIPSSIGVPIVPDANNINFQNTAATDSSAFLQVANNLSDVNNELTARTNLGLGQNVINYIEVPLTSAEFLNMSSVPFALIPEPGASTYILVDRMEIDMYFFGGIAYAGGGTVAAQYGSAINLGGVLATSSIGASSFYASNNIVFLFSNVQGAIPYTSVAPAGLYLSNGTANFTTGNSTFLVKIWYKIIPLYL